MADEWPIVAPNDDGIRPTGPSDACLYCRSKVSEPHGRECVAVNRRVLLRYVIEIECEVPASWDQAQIEFHRNEGSWCASNAVEEISALSQKLDESGGCLCNVFKAEYVRDVDSTPRAKAKTDEQLDLDRAMRDLIVEPKP